MCRMSRPKSASSAPHLLSTTPYLPATIAHVIFAHYDYELCIRPRPVRTVGRANAEYVIFTDDSVKRYQDFEDSHFVRKDDNLGIKYERPEIFEDTILLLRYNCPDPSCDVACLGWPDLHRHVKSAHQKVMCDLCTRNKKVFTHEHELFTMAELRRHEKFGDDNPGAVDQSGFRGHPECGFCRQRFYGDDELYTHCRDKHERCHICDRRNQGRQQQYFVDYDSLELHFRKDHFLCPDKECLEKKFVVFDSEIDLKAHQLDAHPNGLSKDARREARRIDMSGFDYRGQLQPDTGRGGRREGRGRGRGRDPNTEAIPHSTAQPLRRDELAYQRQMAVQSAQTISTRTFGGQLTSSDAFSARPPTRGAAEPDTVSARRPQPSGNGEPPSLRDLSITGGSNTPSQSIPGTTSTPQEQARQLRHNAVMDRAAGMLKNDSRKVADFRSKVSLYQRSGMSAPQLIDGFFALFDTSAAELGKLIKELAEIYEAEAKRQALLKAWNDWRAINEDYPALPGPSGLLAGSSTSTLGGARVLKLKSSTAQSSRSSVSRHGSWSSAGSDNPFPPMASTKPKPSRQPNNGVAGAARGPTSSSQSAAPSSARKSNTAFSSAKNATVSEAFPALPAAAKPTSSIFGYGTGAVKRTNGQATPTRAWGNGASGSSANVSAAASEAEDTDAAQGGKRKGKNKKQTLFQWG
ncbi:MAG: hypothetical protein M1817_001792 [Caeruleum heppii]|nr:MAG: hypothetical protein M1817_001792 [Caeruleum heppii]